MPLTGKGREIMSSMTAPPSQGGYGKKKGEQVFYASRNKGTITGVEDADDRRLSRMMDACMMEDRRSRARDAVSGLNTKCPDCGQRFEDGIDSFPTHNAADGRLCAMSKKKVQTVEPRYGGMRGRLHRALDRAIAARRRAR